MAVDVSIQLGPTRPDDLVLDTMMRAQAVTGRMLREIQLGRADAVIRPLVGGVTWADWDAFDAMVEVGRQAARYWLGLSTPAVPAVDEPTEPAGA
jgi:hypothetical protein